MRLTFFRYLTTSSNRRNPKIKDVIAWMVVIKYLKSSGDDLLLQTSFSVLGDHIFWNEKRHHLGLTKSEGICKRFDYIPNRIESVENLNTGTKIRDRSSSLGVFLFSEKKWVGSAAIKQGRLANRKHTYFFFFGPIYTFFALMTSKISWAGTFLEVFTLCILMDSSFWFDTINWG